jgi:hypothetical protein
VTLAITTPPGGSGIFVPDDVTFSGIAHSIVFHGGNMQLAIDDVTMTSVPEPPAWGLLAIGSVACWVASRRRRTGAGSGDPIISTPPDRSPSRMQTMPGKSLVSPVSAHLEFAVACFGHGKPIKSNAAMQFRKQWPAVRESAPQVA